jgi:23S rRNA (adenine1618-N6)-methyltransferase
MSLIKSDIDNDNIRTSTHTIKANGLDSRIQVVKRSSSDSFVPLDKVPRVERYCYHVRAGLKLTAQRLDFTMCNPPFYSSQGEMIASAEEKERPPFSVHCSSLSVYNQLLIIRNRHAQAQRLKW